MRPSCQVVTGDALVNKGGKYGARVDGLRVATLCGKPATCRYQGGGTDMLLCPEHAMDIDRKFLWTIDGNRLPGPPSSQKNPIEQKRAGDITTDELNRMMREIYSKAAVDSDYIVFDNGPVNIKSGETVTVESFTRYTEQREPPKPRPVRDPRPKRQAKPKVVEPEPHTPWKRKYDWDAE